MAIPFLRSIPAILILYFFVSPQLSLSIPFIVLHGIADQCSTQKMTEFTQNLIQFSGSTGYCIEVGDGTTDSWLMPLGKQTRVVCDKVKELKELESGFNIVGLSQGNLIGRGVVEFCDDRPPVLNFISLGGPHAGIAYIPLCGCDGLCQFTNKLIKSEIYTNFVQDHLAPSGYYKLPDNIDKYLRKCKFLPKLNNEIPGARNATYKTRFSSLNNLVLIMFEQDNVLIPKETSWFGYYPQGKSEGVIPVQQSQLYKEDWIGLRALDNARKVKFICVTGGHVQISIDDMKKYVVPYLKS